MLFRSEELLDVERNIDKESFPERYERVLAELENYRAEDKQVVLNAEKLVLQFGIAAKTGTLGKLINLDIP